ncbi:MAG: peroxiredoxin family protein [Saprospiraceae bacterium]|nr:peroxiredoxin family protein [Saprospiraceae bacterium]
MDPNAERTMALNNLLKSTFIGLFPMLALFLSIRAGIRLVDKFELSTLGLFIMAMTVVSLFAMVFLKKMARGYANLRAYELFLLIGLILFLVGYFRGTGSTTNLLGVLAILCAWTGYIRWYSTFPTREKELLRVGQTLPSFEVEDIHQNKITDQTLLGQKNLLLFFRGNWCPLCMAQIKEVAAEYQELETLGVKTYLISPQPPSHSISLAKKHQVNFNYLVDKGNGMAKRFKIFAENGLPMGLQVLGYDSDTVLPTVLVTDEQGQIIFADLTDNYRFRPEPASFLEIIRKQTQ